MPYIRPRGNGEKRKISKREGLSGEGKRRSLALQKERRETEQREGIVNGHEGSRHETNEYRKGRPWLSRCASRSGGKKVEEDDGKKSERAKVRGRHHFKRPAHASSLPPFRLLSSPQGACCRRSRPGLRVHRVERGRKGEKETRNGEEAGGGAPETTTLDSYNCSFLQIPRFLPATTKFGNLWRES